MQDSLDRDVSITRLSVLLSRRQEPLLRPGITNVEIKVDVYARVSRILKLEMGFPLILTFLNPLRPDTQNVISRTSSYEADTLDDRVKPGIGKPCCSADQAQGIQ